MSSNTEQQRFAELFKSVDTMKQREMIARVDQIIASKQGNAPKVRQDQGAVA